MVLPQALHLRRFARRFPRGRPAGPPGTHGHWQTLITLGLAPSQADVLVCSRGGGGLFKERMQLLGLLWEAGIRAEMVAEANPSAQEQYEYAHVRHIPFMATLAAATFSAADTIKVATWPGPPPPLPCLASPPS